MQFFVLKIIFVTRILKVLVLSSCILACQPQTEVTKQSDHLEALAWVRDVDLQASIVQAKKQGDYRLYGITSRGVSYPGIALNESEYWVERCGMRLKPGFTDVLHGKEHIQLLEKAYRYVEAYNQAILKLCQQSQIKN